MDTGFFLIIVVKSYSENYLIFKNILEINNLVMLAFKLAFKLFFFVFIASDRKDFYNW
jgi:hypothetical protein